MQSCVAAGYGRCLLFRLVPSVCSPASSQGALDEIRVVVVMERGDVKQKRRLAKHMCLHMSVVTEFFFCIVS